MPQMTMLSTNCITDSEFTAQGPDDRPRSLSSCRSFATGPAMSYPCVAERPKAPAAARHHPTSTGTARPMMAPPLIALHRHTSPGTTAHRMAPPHIVRHRRST